MFTIHYRKTPTEFCPSVRGGISLAAQQPLSCVMCAVYFQKEILGTGFFSFFQWIEKGSKSTTKEYKSCFQKSKLLRNSFFQNDQSCCLEEGALQLTSFYVMFTIDLYFTKNCQIFIPLQCNIINCNAHYRCNHVHGTIKIVYFWCKQCEIIDKTTEHLQQQVKSVIATNSWCWNGNSLIVKNWKRKGKNLLFLLIVFNFVLYVLFN